MSRSIFSFCIPARILLFEGGQRLRGVVIVTSGRETEEFAVAGRDRADKRAEVLVHSLIRVAANALPEKIGAAVDPRDRIALPRAAGKDAC